jgi:pyroglutamyl-peptidase
MLAKALDGQVVGGLAVRAAVLPVERGRAAAMATALLAEVDPVAVVHTGLAAGRARLALERVAVNVDDYEIADNAGHRPRGEPCLPGGPAAYLATWPLGALLDALRREGVPAYVSNSAGTYLCNHVLYATLHAVAARPAPLPVGFVHVPLLPSMVAAGGLDQPSMAFETALRGLEVVLAVVAGAVAAPADRLAGRRPSGSPGRSPRQGGRPPSPPAPRRRR